MVGRLNGCCAFGEATFASTHENEQDAPKADLLIGSQPRSGFDPEHHLTSGFTKAQNGANFFAMLKLATTHLWLRPVT